ncbi:hypothetical protein Tco_0569048, partial [Tanacetum coccineum]
ATPTPTPTTSVTTTLLPALLDFASVFKFNERVFNLEKDVSEINQVDQYAQALSSIPAIVDRYIDNKLGEAINKAILAHNLDCRQEAQDEKKAYIELVDTSMRALIKEEVNTQLPQILPQAVSDFANLAIEKNRTRDDSDKDRDHSTGSDRGKKRRKSSKDAESSRDSRSKEKKFSSTSKDVSKSQHKSSGKSAHLEEPSHTVEDSGMQQDQEFVTRENDEQPADKELNDTSFDFSAFIINRLKIPNLTQKILVGPAFNLLKGTCKSITELEYHFEEYSKATIERLRKPLPLIQDHRGRQIIPKDYFINNDLEYLKGRDLSRRYSTSVTKIKAATYDLKWIKDLVQELWSPV